MVDYPIEDGMNIEQPLYVLCFSRNRIKPVSFNYLAETTGELRRLLWETRGKTLSSVL